MSAAFLALWNDIDRPEARAEYEAWHAFEHVPERVGLPGFVYGYRYVGASGYFTLYGLESLAALDSAEYADVIANPTPWSARMRPRLSAFMRRPCRLQVQAGVSCGAALTTLKAVTTDVQAWAAQAARWAGQAVQQRLLLRVTAGAAPVERSLYYPVGGERIAEQAQGEVTVVMLAEHLDGPTCAQGAQWWADRMQAHHLEKPTQQAFALQTRVYRSQLALPASGRLPPLMELMAGYADC
ncbi:hypothetical protein [Comamonas guangdongensis]|uniref:Uncharacterized protein n=1 Tax=Comamonas guangdongensis TaxID=510515 RepID=A0ABV3ZZX0_9BURK